MEVELVDSVPAPAPTPAPAPSPEAPAEPAAIPETATEPAADTQASAASAPSPELFRLPDGREVDAAGLKREYENLLPEFTRRSQRLADYERGQAPSINNPEVPKWKDPNYVPQSYAELIEFGKQAALEELQQAAMAEESTRTAVVTQVESELATIKSKDPKLNEDALFTHANKYGFNNLIAAHENMEAIRKAAYDAEQRALKNIGARKTDPIAGGGTPAAAPTGQSYGANTNFGSALEYFRHRNS